MASHPRATPGDGVRVVRTSAVRRVVRLTLLAMSAVVLVVVVALLGLRMPPAGTAAPPAASPAEPAPPSPPVAQRPDAPPLAPLTVAERPAAPEARAPSARAVRRAPPTTVEPPEKEDEPFTIGGPDEQGGLKVFPPMGTKPIKRGIIVPDDYELPPGYVRHFQSTDDGERLPAILMFSPDYDWVDAEGRPVALPADRVVPPEMAPPGLRVELLEPPAQKPPPDNRP
jgi:hypothetical protein